MPKPTAAGDLFFNEWLIPSGDKLPIVVKWVLAALESVEARHRARRKDDQKRHEEMVGTILANLAHAVLVRRDAPSVAVVLSKNAEAAGYSRPIFRLMPRALRHLEERGLIATCPARKAGLTGTIEPTAALTAELAPATLRFSDFARHPDEEVLEVRWSRYERRGGGRPTRERDRMPIRETPETLRLRAQIRRINAFLASADITVEGGAEHHRIDNYDRRLHRHFTVLTPDAEDHWCLNGRLFGGFWQTLPKAQRSLIRIDGEELADLDFENLFVRLAYCKLGIEPPSGDLYALPGIGGCYRAGVKALVSAFLFAPAKRTTIPPNLREELPQGITAKAARAAILSRHPDLAPILETGAGFSLMHTESEILIEALKRLATLGIPALPMHDGLMVAGSEGRRARVAMLEAAAALTSFRLPVSLGGVQTAQGEGGIVSPPTL